MNFKKLNCLVNRGFFCLFFVFLLLLLFVYFFVFNLPLFLWSLSSLPFPCPLFECQTRQGGFFTSSNAYSTREMCFSPWCPIWIQETLLPLMEPPPFTSAKKLSSFLRIMRALSESFLDGKCSLSWESPFGVAPNSSSLMQLTQFSASSQAASKEAPQEQSMSWMK